MINIDITDMSQYEAMIPENRPIMHLSFVPSVTSTCIISALEDDLDCHIEVCNSWPALVVRLSSLANSIAPPLLVIDSDILQDRLPTVPDISNMMSVIYKCMELPEKIHLAVALTQPCSTEFIKELQHADIRGVIPCVQQFGYERVLESIKEILGDHMYWPKDVISVVTNTQLPNKKMISTKLTRRQTEVFTLVSKRGLSNKKIAAMLDISESTVKLHMGVILKKYGVTNRTQLAVFASGI